MTEAPTTNTDPDGCRPSCAARRNPNAECVCAELDLRDAELAERTARRQRFLDSMRGR